MSSKVIKSPANWKIPKNLLFCEHLFVSGFLLFPLSLGFLRRREFARRNWGFQAMSQLQVAKSVRNLRDWVPKKIVRTDWLTPCPDAKANCLSSVPKESRQSRVLF